MKKIGTCKPDNLLAGSMYRSTAQITLEAGMVYPVGSVLALKVSGVCCLVDSATENKDVYTILASEVDATEAEAPGTGYQSGEFNANVLVFGRTDTYQDHIDKARTLGLYFITGSKAIKY